MKKISIIASLVVLSLLSAAPAQAQLDFIEGGECKGLPCAISVGGGSGLASYIQDAVNAAITVILAIAVLFLVYAGYKYVTSTGSEEAAAQAKRQIAYASLGVIIALFASFTANTSSLAYNVIAGVAEGNVRMAELRILAGRFIDLA